MRVLAAVWVCGGTYDLPLMLMPLGSFVDTIRLKANQGPRSGQTQLATQCLLRAVLLGSPERRELCERFTRLLTVTPLVVSVSSLTDCSHRLGGPWSSLMRNQLIQI